MEVENEDNNESNEHSEQENEFNLMANYAQFENNEDVDPINVEMSTATPFYKPKTEFERYMVKQMQTLVNHHSTYTSRLDKLDQENVALHKLLGNQNLGAEIF